MTPQSSHPHREIIPGREGTTIVVDIVGEEIELHLSMLTPAGYSGITFWVTPQAGHAIANALLRASNSIG